MNDVKQNAAKEYIIQGIVNNQYLDDLNKIVNGLMM
jgi:hypothetical protein